jgi:spermidine/putrescine-binding protein
MYAKLKAGAAGYDVLTPTSYMVSVMAAQDILQKLDHALLPNLVHGYSGDILQVQAENVDIAFAMPREGGAISCDDLIIPRNAKEAKLAHAFINFLHDPAVAAENI